MTMLYKASEMVGKLLNQGDLAIYNQPYILVLQRKSVPILEKYSGLKFNKDFYCGYSPED